MYMAISYLGMELMYTVLRLAEVYPFRRVHVIRHVVFWVYLNVMHCILDGSATSWNCESGHHACTSVTITRK